LGKTRIHDLAKEYGMPGKDLAARLRDFGFGKAKSHMSALDEFEVMQAEAVLGANGIMRADAKPAEQPEGESLGGGLIVKRKLKKKVAEEPAATEEEEEEAPEPAPEPVVSEEPAPAAAQVEPEPAAEPAPRASDEQPEVAPAAAETAEPVEAEPHADVEHTPAPSELEAPAAEDAAPATAASRPAPAPAPSVARAKPRAKAAEAKKATPKGKIVKFIDPSTFQTARPERKRESRRLQSRDDVAPDVRPTFGARGRGGSGPRGNLTAAELREREQSRFLRRNRTAGGPGGGGGRRTGGRGGSRSSEQVTMSPLSGQSVVIEMPVTMSKLAETLKLKSGVVQKLSMQKGYGMFTVNSLLDEDTAVLLAHEYDVELEVRHEITAEQAHLEDVKLKRSAVEDDELVPRAPTVAFLGHVDHGKTTLIDRLRATSVAEGEAGGITQHIGAYQVEADGHRITILDTPGHQAFTAMRARGAKAVDIVVLVVAGDDGVKPSTEEAINHAKAAKTPIVVALNKSDKPGFNAAATIQQLMGHELIPEAYGGTTAMHEVSGMTGAGIDKLLSHLVLMGEAELDLRAHNKGPASGVVLEAEIQQGRGIVAHLLVQDGTLTRGDIILAGEGYGKVKAIQDDRGEFLEEAGPSTPVSVTGLDALPGVGDPFHVIESLSKAKEIALERERTNRAMALASKREPSRELEAILGSAPKQDRSYINLIVRADVQGSVEVIKHELEKLTHDEVEVKLVHSGVGPITESDVDLAATSDAMLVAFHVAVAGKVRQEAERRKLSIARYDVIYELLDDLRNLMEGSLAPELREEVIGHVEIKRLFKSSRIGLIAGCVVLDGIVKRSSKVRLLRDDVVVYTGGISSLRRESDDAKEVREGFECGIVLKDYRDIREGDIVEAYRVHEIKRTLA
jgi:translation initiation factor IF-2